MLSLNVIGYLFLGGVGGGMGLASSVIALLALREQGPRAFKTCKPLLSASHCAAACCLGFACLLLIADLGRPDRLLVLFLSPTMTFLFAGTMALSACLALNTLLALVWSGLLARVAKWTAPLHIALMAGSLFVMVYTGLLLASLGSVPLWHTPWLPVLFFLSACSCGIAAVLMVGQFRSCVAQFPVLFERMMHADAVLIVAEGLVTAAFLHTALHAGSATQTDVAAVAGAASLMEGRFARLFWVSFVLCGMAVPFVLEVLSCLLGKIEHRSPYVLLWASALVLAGGLFMRLAVVAAGTQPALIFGA